MMMMMIWCFHIYSILFILTINIYLGIELRSKKKKNIGNGNFFLLLLLHVTNKHTNRLKKLFFFHYTFIYRFDSNAGHIRVIPKWIQFYSLVFIFTLGIFFAALLKLKFTVKKFYFILFFKNRVCKKCQKIVYNNNNNDHHSHPLLTFCCQCTGHWI